GKLHGLAGKRVVLLLCGGNIDPNVLSRVIERGLVADGRLCRFSAVISDRPGGLADLAAQIAAAGASVKQVVHDRAFAGSDDSAGVGTIEKSAASEAPNQPAISSAEAAKEFTFADRHIGPSDNEIEQMLRELGFDKLDELINATIPENIRFRRSLDLPPAKSE